MFSAQGYAATSMRQVAEQAGLALGGIYNHFPSKAALFQAVLQAGAAEPAGGGPAAWAARLERHPEYLRLLLIELVEFQGQHLPQLRSQLPAGAAANVGAAAAYHLTRLLRAGLGPAGAPPALSPEMFAGIFGASESVVE